MRNSRCGTVSIVNGDHIAIDGYGQATTLECCTDRFDDQPKADILVFHVIEALAQIGDLAFKSINNSFLHLVSCPGHAVPESKEASEETSYGEEETDNTKGGIDIWHRCRSF